MTNGIRKRLLFATILLVILALPLTAQDNCGLCHPESRVEFAVSTHALEGVLCIDCHGGDPDTQVVERAHQGAFRSLTNRLEVPAMCAGCHSDLDRMRPYNLPVDQYAIYQTSQHGRAVAKGDTRPAICTDCHGVHDSRSPDDPESLTHPRNIAGTCGQCHGDAELMGQYGIDNSVIDDYRTSVHGRALIEGGNSAAPNCTSCHGVHGSAPPGFGDVDKVCGACHEQTRRAFLEGPHYEAMLAAEMPECESCHSNHAIRRFEMGAVETLCADCHGEDSEQSLLGRKLYTLILTATETVDKAEELALEGEKMALDVEDHLARIEEARTHLTEAPPLVHAVSLEAVEQVTRRARSIGEEVQHEIYAKLDRTEAHIVLAVFWFYVGMTLIILVLLKRRMLARSETS